MTDNDKNELDKALSAMSNEQIEEIEKWLKQNRNQEEKPAEIQEEKQVEKPVEKLKPRMCLCGVHEVPDGEYYCVFCKLKNPFLFR
jgi:hypothetical protein